MDKGHDYGNNCGQNDAVLGSQGAPLSWEQRELAEMRVSFWKFL